MAYKTVQMGLRGLNLFLMMLGLMYNWEGYELSTTPHFIMSGVYGAYIVVTMGLLIEAGMYLDSDKFIESSYLISAIALNLLCSVIAIIEYLYLVNQKHEHEAVNKGLISMLSVSVYLIDVILLYYKITAQQ